jgi:hypothetical protein
MFMNHQSIKDDSVSNVPKDSGKFSKATLVRSITAVSQQRSSAETAVRDDETDQSSTNPSTSSHIPGGAAERLVTYSERLRASHG